MHSYQSQVNHELLRLLSGFLWDVVPIRQLTDLVQESGWGGKERWPKAAAAWEVDKRHQCELPQLLYVRHGHLGVRRLWWAHYLFWQQTFGLLPRNFFWVRLGRGLASKDFTNFDITIEITLFNFNPSASSSDFFNLQSLSLYFFEVNTNGCW